MKKYLELFDGAFDASVTEKVKPENKPYVAYSKTDGVVYTVIPEEPTFAYQMIDLGLPSGLKWADRNVGAETPQDNGLYFSWGNTEGHAVDENGNVVDDYSFDWENTPYSTVDEYGNPVFSKYNGTDGIIVLEAIDDAVTVNIGGDWRMPTKDEMVELVQNTDHYYISENGSFVAGPFTHETNAEDKGLDGSELRSICFVKKGEGFNYNDRSNFIEFPFAGNCYGSMLGDEGLLGCVWSSSVDDFSVEDARFLYFKSSGKLYDAYGGSRLSGLSVRGVHA